MGIKQFIKNLGIFFIYLCTQPFKAIANLFKVSMEKEKEMAYFKAWRIPLLALTIVFYIVGIRTGNMIGAHLFGILLILTILKTEWDERKWMAMYREVKRKKAEKKLEKQKLTEGN